MKIAFIYDCAYPWIKGGVEKRIYEIGKRLAERGHDVHWYCVGWWLDENDQRDIEIDGIKYHGVCGPLQPYVNGRRSIKAAIGFSLSLLWPLLRGKFDLIDCQNFPYFPYFPAKLVSLVRSTQLLITWHEFWGDYWYSYLGRKGLFGKITEKIVSIIADYNLSVSQKTARDLEYNGIRVLGVIPNGIDITVIESIKPSELSSDVIFAGRIIKHKNVDLLIKAISLIRKDIPDIKCLIIGEGPEKSRCERLSGELDLNNNITFLPFLEDESSLISYMKSSRVFVLPSTREGFGIVALEANAAGLPVITSNYPLNAGRELINDKNGVLFDLSPEDLKEKIIFMLKKSEALRDECIEFSRQYSWDKIAELTEKVYLEVLK